MTSSTSLRPTPITLATPDAPEMNIVYRTALIDGGSANQKIGSDDSFQVNAASRIIVGVADPS
ncbi:hypothetical protein [Streptomyces sp. NPDC056492]|uniref:hypothetical protein n=1 Tax=Streptomyces sp. NPDC056492 TaxID=3345838 RepID=UPI0036AA58CB